ncbi:Triosephosphate isomerase [Candidatus Kinetoplastibacterium sorsogonicusi]|uniref:Triosephosphate isomerase n=1 Tax=Candidatus Kinetoplastidibacterium kentomonadis TaxID=1576550 RepID=A0A3Q8F6T0_9PROT|nr:triose-phosphate isomerase [Candidatus Kinetoplastibacterium sorsogonicusi]AWD32599.1 Triosephosphate isomerase [Candidatus Kinetoplastibacterium sorsogonicusi]
MNKSHINSKFIIGNWKMNGSLKENFIFLSKLKNINSNKYHQMGICVPFPYLFQANELLNGSKILWGAQDISSYDKGAYTGQVSAFMIKDFNCKLVIIGHSERRLFQHENESIIFKKIVISLNNSLIPIVCFGETLNIRNNGNTLAYIDKQLKKVFKLNKDLLSRVIFAYEPLWAIGSGYSATQEQIYEVHNHVKKRLYNLGVTSTCILYGGSVNSKNSSYLLNISGVDGVLIGGASLLIDEFLKISIIS